MYSEIKNYLQEHLSEKRYIHTLGVADECLYYSDIFALDEYDRDLLYKAALFHDITKENTPDEHISICRVYDIEFDKAYMFTPALFHALTGGEFARELFPSVCTDDVIGLITTHTTGKENMSLLQKILFLADSTEPNRKHESCIELRNLFHNNVTDHNKSSLLDRCIIKSLDNTIRYLLHKGAPVAPDTIMARNFLLTNSEVKI